MCLGLFQFARQFSRDEPLTFEWVCRHVNWPLVPPKNIKDLMHLEAVHDVLDLYLWLRCASVSTQQYDFDTELECGYVCVYVFGRHFCPKQLTYLKKKVEY